MVAVAENRRPHDYPSNWGLEGYIVQSVTIIITNSTLSSID